jgi:GTP-binding protein HflX
LVSDTVGFLANLPHELIASFRATLEEARHADLLLIVADASDRDVYDQLQVTYRTLEEIGASDVPRQLVLNKVDLLAARQRESLALTYPDAWLLSAHDAADVETLRTRLQQHFAAGDVEGTVVVPFRHGEWVAELHRGARVLKQHPTSRGTRLHVRAPREVWSRWKRCLPRGVKLQDL